MELYHSTNLEITKIDPWKGKFGAFLFFGNAQSGKSHGNIVYKLEVEENSIIESSAIFYQENSRKILEDIIQETQELCDCDEQTAMNYLDETKSYPVCDCDGAEISWNIQHLTAQAAKKLGFRGVAVKDEHGISYMIDMLNKEHELQVGE